MLRTRTNDIIYDRGHWILRKKHYLSNVVVMLAIPTLDAEVRGSLGVEGQVDYQWVRSSWHQVVSLMVIHAVLFYIDIKRKGDRQDKSYPGSLGSYKYCWMDWGLLAILVAQEWCPRISNQIHFHLTRVAVGWFCPIVSCAYSNTAVARNGSYHYTIFQSTVSFLFLGHKLVTYSELQFE